LIHIEILRNVEFTLEHVASKAGQVTFADHSETTSLSVEENLVVSGLVTQSVHVQVDCPSAGG